MQRQFFNLENILLGSLFLILLIYSGFMMSCQMPNGGSNIFSVSDDEDDDNVAVADKRRRSSSSRDRRPCEDRDSCQDSCDYMFRNSRARSECYELNFDDVSDLEHVFDELHASSISKRSLQDIDVGDFEDFLALDTDGWVDIIVGEEGSDHDNHDAYSSGDARSALEWIAENEDVARAIARADDNHDTLYHLFLRLGDENDTTKRFTLSSSQTENNGSVYIEWSSRYGVELNSSSKRVSLGDQVLKFVLSFIGSSADLKFDGDSFITYAYDEDNEQAVELAHESLVRFCEEGTSDELPDEDVQQCMLAVYCSIYDEENDENIFEDVLSNYSADPQHCAVKTLVRNTNDKLEKLF